MQKRNIDMKLNKASGRNQNRHICSYLLSRCQIFHPMRSVSEINNLDKNISYDTPLKIKEVWLMNIKYLISIKSFPLFEAHREVLDSMIAAGMSIRINKNSSESKIFTWEDVLDATDNALNGKLLRPSTKDILKRQFTSDTVVMCISDYQLTLERGLQPKIKNYENGRRMIQELSNFSWDIQEIRPEKKDDILFYKGFSFVKDYLFTTIDYGNKRKKANYIFVVIDPEYIKNLKKNGFFPIKKQFLMKNYSKNIGLRSFIKYLETHNENFLKNRPLDWCLEQFKQTFCFDCNQKCFKRLKDALKAFAPSLEKNFGIKVTYDAQGEALLSKDASISNKEEYSPEGVE